MVIQKLDGNLGQKMGMYVGNRVDAGLNVARSLVGCALTPRLIMPRQRAVADKAFGNSLLNNVKAKFNIIS